MENMTAIKRCSQVIRIKIPDSHRIIQSKNLSFTFYTFFQKQFRRYYRQGSFLDYFIFTRIDIMQEFFEDLLTQSQVYCPKKHKGRLICFNPKCNDNAIICGDLNCQNCSEKHDFCINYRLQTMFREIVKKRQIVTPQIKLALEAIDKILQEAIQKLSTQRQYYRNQYSLLGLSQNEINFLRQMKEGSLQQMSPKQVSKVMRELHQKRQWGIDAKNIKNYWSRHEKQFRSLFENIKSLAFKSTARIQSKIISNTEILSSLFPKKIKELNLLFRGSDYAFSVNEFHNKVQNKQNLLVLAQTQFGKIIGGYTPLTFTVGKGYLKDKKCKSFLFSLSNKQIYPLKKNQNAIQATSRYMGPSFGMKDFSVGNAANASNSSVFSIGSAYGYPEKYVNALQAIAAFTGASKSANSVKLKEWEVFQIS